MHFWIWLIGRLTATGVPDPFATEPHITTTSASYQAGLELVTVDATTPDETGFSDDDDDTAGRSSKCVSTAATIRPISPGDNLLDPPCKAVSSDEKVVDTLTGRLLSSICNSAESSSILSTYNTSKSFTASTLQLLCCSLVNVLEWAGCCVRCLPECYACLFTPSDKQHATPDLSQEFLSY